MEKVRETNIGSSFDEFLESEGILGSVTAIAHKRVLAWQIEQAMKASHVTQVEMAKRMHTSRSSVHRLLDPDNPSITLDTIDRAANALGMKIDISIVHPQAFTPL
jgi:predicted XRE-type DNA-binding protein